MAGSPFPAQTFPVVDANWRLRGGGPIWHNALDSPDVDPQLQGIGTDGGGRTSFSFSALPLCSDRWLIGYRGVAKTPEALIALMQRPFSRLV